MNLTISNLNYLLNYCIEILKKISVDELVRYKGILFESLLQETLKKAAIKLEIKNIHKIELVSGQRFPDIIICTKTEKIGIEVKTSQSMGWRTLGGSIYESTRIEGINDIYIFYANYSDLKNISFKYKKIEDSIVDVVITHKPRYIIDLEADETFFNKTGISYKELRKSQKPFSLIRNYMKNKANKTSDLWWVSDEEDSIDNLGPQSINDFSDLSKEEKNGIINEVYAMFPNILSDSNSKYKEIALFLTAKKGIAHACLRDSFSAGGKIKFNNYCFPKYFNKILQRKELLDIVDLLKDLNYDYLEEYWGKFNDKERLQVWCRKITFEINSNNKIQRTAKNIILSHIKKELFG